jgi:hypothetical protein
MKQKSKIKLDEDYEYVGISEEPEWAIRLLTGKYKETIVRYTQIKLESIDTAKEGEDDVTLGFAYHILNETVLPDDYNDEEAGQYFGDVLMAAIETGLDDGTAVLDER